MFSLFEYFSRSRPTQPDPIFSHYLKTVRNVVYLNNSDDLVRDIVVWAATLSLLTFLALGFSGLDNRQPPAE